MRKQGDYEKWQLIGWSNNDVIWIIHFQNEIWHLFYAFFGFGCDNITRVTAGKMSMIEYFLNRICTIDIIIGTSQVAKFFSLGYDF